MTQLQAPKLDSEDEFGPGLDLPDEDGLVEVDASVEETLKRPPLRHAPMPPPAETYGLHDYRLLTLTAKSNQKILEMQKAHRESQNAYASMQSTISQGSSTCGSLQTHSRSSTQTFA